MIAPLQGQPILLAGSVRERLDVMNEKPV